MRGSITLGHVRGIPIRAHFTLFFVLPYLAFLMAVRFQAVARQAGVRGESMFLPPVVWGLILAVSLFACVLLHELGHSLLALRYGGKVSSITLMLLGGVSELHGMPRTPKTEGLIAAAGPLVSLLLGALAMALYSVIPSPPDLRFGLFYLGEINLALAIFNILPAFPMDGGRVLRAILSTHWSRVSATRIAAATGSVFAGLFVVLGLLSGNLLLALIGLFVWSGARAESQQVIQEELFRGLRVRDVMTPGSEVLQASEPVTQAAVRMAATHQTALPVVDGTELVGIVSAQHLESLRPEERERTRVSAVVSRDVPWLDSDESLTGALERMAEQKTEDAPVLHDAHLVGMLDVSDLSRLMRLRKLSAPAEEGRLAAIGRETGPGGYAAP